MSSSVRIVVLDYYMSAPIPGLDATYSEFRSTSISQVPVLRCFGSTAIGKKICVHIHGVFPYLYIPYDGRGKPEELMYQITHALDKAINVSFNQASSNTQHIYKISLVSGIPMYGYHSKKHQFFKIYLYNPKLVAQVGNILMNKLILEQMFQPHEVHLNFTLQFMIDYNLHGMSDMLISEIKYRVNPDNANCDIDQNLLLPPNIEKTTICELEADINAESILNRQEILSGNLAVNPGIAALWEDEKQRRRNKNEDSQLGNFLDLKNMICAPTKTHLIFQQALKDRLAVLSIDKDIPKHNSDASIYAAETPNDANIQNASLIDIQSVSSLELSLDDTINMSCSQFNNETLTPSGDDPNVTMDEDAQEFLHLLKDLAEEKLTENEVEDDGILSQVPPDDQNDDFAEDLLDLSMPLAAITTPIKLNIHSGSHNSDDEDTDYFNTTLIPQMDGQIDSTDSDNESTMNRIGPVKQKCGRSMPLLDVDDTFSNRLLSTILDKLNLAPYVKLDRLKCDTVVKIQPLDMNTNINNWISGPITRSRSRRTPEEILEETLRLIRYRINRIDTKSRVKKIGQKLRLHDKYTMHFCQKNSWPKFNVLPGRKWFLDKRPRDGSVISRLLELTHKYTDPDLHIFVKTPLDEYLFNYRGYPFPAISPIYSKTRSKRRVICGNDLRISKTRKNDHVKRRKLFLLQKQILNIRPRPKRKKPLKKDSVIDQKLVEKVEDFSENVGSDLSYDLGSEVEVHELKNEPKMNLYDSKFENDLRSEVQAANLTLQSHLTYLKHFDYNVEDEKSHIRDSTILTGIKCLTEENLDKTKIGVFHNGTNYKKIKMDVDDGNTCNEQSLVKEMANMLICSETEPIDSETLKPTDLNINKTQIEAELNVFCGFTDCDNEVASIMAKGDNTKDGDVEKNYKTILNQSNRYERSVSISDYSDDTFISAYTSSKNVSYDSETELLSNLATSVQKTPPGKRSISTSFDSDYASFSGNTSTRQTFFDSEDKLTFDLATSQQEQKCSSDFSDLDSSGVSSFIDKSHSSCGLESQPSGKADHSSFPGNGLIRPSSCYSVFKLPGNSLEAKSKSSCFVEDQKSKPQINVISDIQLLSPFNVKFARRSVSSIPFGYGTGALFNKRSELEKTSSYSDKIINNGRNLIPSIYINCDGAADSSSEDEKVTKSPMKTARKRLSKSQFAPLRITVTKSPRIQGNCPGGLLDNMVGFSGDHEHSQESSSKINNQNSLMFDTPYKRKLVFGNETTLNNTISEEFVSCTHSPKPKPSDQIENSSRCHFIYNNSTTDRNNTNFSQAQSATPDSVKEATSEIAVPNNSQNYDLSSSDSDLFSDDDNNVNRSFFKAYNLSVSEKYDLENKFKAKQGCSTIFSPSSLPSSGSLKCQENRVVSDNTSSDIPPYQESTQLSGILLKDAIGAPNQITTNAKNISSSFNNSQNRKINTANIIMPLLKAPSRSRVEATLSEYKIARVRQQEPFYSNVHDYTGVVEVGHRIMRIMSKTTAHLPEFDSEYSGLNTHRKNIVENVANLKWNSNNIKSLKLSYCRAGSVILHPVKKSPTVDQVKKWVEANSKPSVDVFSPETKTERTKIYIPNSPGNESLMDLSLSLTPCSQSSASVVDAPESTSSAEISSSPILYHRKRINKKKTLINRKPPSLRDSILLSAEANKSCQISGLSQQNSFGFDKSVQNLQAVRAIAEHQFLTTMVMELHIRNRAALKPDPQFDSICGIFYSILNDVPESNFKKSKARGVIAVNCLPMDLGTPRSDFLNGIEFDCDITYVETEEALVNSFVSLIKYWDPDILAGYEIEMLSWGYLVERASVLSINILPMLGRSELHKFGKTKLKCQIQDLDTHIIGRIVLNVWKIMRHEIALQSYTFESIVYHILHKRLPVYPLKDLTFWWDHRSNLYRHRVLRYYLQRVDTILELFDKLDFLNRTSELARLFGILFFEVLSRGSQFRVESMMLRLAKPLNYVPVSPNTRQRANMKAPEYIALVMEPESKLYTDPVIVLDFQSLYPSIIIAYNYCFTTCLGRVNYLGTNNAFEFGATQLKVPKKIAEKLCKRDLLNYSPCGVAYVKQNVREGILPRMLKEVLDTRLMVKNSMKENKGNDNLQKVLHNRQLGLKLIANVTYGYTAANFSGRMCCVEVGDSVVSKGRETLQRAVAMVESTREWEAKVVYGDTDSMFVLVSGKTREEAFEIGKKIADAVTADNPDPIKLKLEKVYQPCILQTKKRYVGYMYEGPDQKDPVYEAKGIETVRRDGCPAVSKMLQKCLTLLFETKNVSLIKSYVLKQFKKIQTGRASIQDLTFAKEYRGASGYKPGACVPALELSRKWTSVDRRNEPRSGERVPYIIVNGPPGLPLIRLVRSPKDLLNDASLRPNALYYITKVIIPPINRCLTLIGADLHNWYNQMPRKNIQYLPNSSPNVKSTISQYFMSKICASCSEPTQEGLCVKCCQKPNVTALTLTEKLQRWEENYNNTLLICQSCTGYLDAVVCTSLDCPVLYRRTQTSNDLQQSTYVRELLSTTSIFSDDNYFGQ